MLQLKNVSKKFGKIIACDNVSFTLNRGEILGLIGENGAGKSTLIKIIAGAVKRDKGDIFIDGEKVEIKSPKDSLKYGISVVYQDFSLVETLTGKQNLELHTRAPFREAKKLIRELKFELDLNKKVSDMNENEKQKTEIVKALLSKPKVLILDESTHALTKEEIKNFFNYLRKIKKDLSIIFISHKLNEVKELADRVLMMKEGRIFEIKKLKEFEVPRVFKPKKVSKRILEVKLDGISIPLYEGLITVLVNFPPRYKEFIFNELFPRAEIIPEEKNDYLFFDLNVKENFSIGLKNFILRFIFHTINEEKLNEKAKRAIEEFKIKASIDDVVETLSGGNQQKLMLSKSFNKNFDILVGYSIFSGLDFKSVGILKEKLIETIKNGKTILLFTEDLEEIKDIASKIFVYQKGEILCLK